MLTLRFRFHRNREDGVYEALETLLLPIAAKLAHQGFLVGGRFSATDITLASLLRPLRIVPHFADHPQLHSLFAWQQRLFREHGRDVAFPYEELIREQRQRSGSARAGELDAGDGKGHHRCGRRNVTAGGTQRHSFGKPLDGGAGPAGLSEAALVQWRWQDALCTGRICFGLSCHAAPRHR
jgi:hypothetical protein